MRWRPRSACGSQHRPGGRHCQLGLGRGVPGGPPGPGHRQTHQAVCSCVETFSDAGLTLCDASVGEANKVLRRPGDAGLLQRYRIMSVATFWTMCFIFLNVPQPHQTSRNIDMFVFTI
ncbi:unnamed protein product [Lymnaea stagnalis]|uniref:Uncharacterized protein n=1 Tax=Lymnaea stagnalis TaxID=6523 RepID=A0AAV2I3Z8_LYMST